MRGLNGIRVVMAAGLVTMVSAGMAVTAPVASQAAVSASGLYSVGSNTYGELGDGTTTAYTSPVTWPVLLSGLPSPVVQVAAGFQTSAALLANGTVWTWGDNGAGDLGYGYASGIVDTPHQVPGLPRITQIALNTAGDSYAVAADGGVWAWGDNTEGALGNGTTTPSYSPVQVPGLTGIWQVAAGSDYVLALREDGTVWAWGENGEGSLGDGTTTNRLVPEQVPGLTAISQVEAGDFASFAVTDGGTLLSWGDNSLGTLGTGISARYTVSPAPVPGLDGVTQVASDGVHTLVLADAAVYSWGTNDCGELGDGTTTARSTPELIDRGPITSVAVGETFLFAGFSAAIEPNGTLLTWGCNRDGQLGQAGSVITVPTPDTELTGVTQIAFGDDVTNLVGGAYTLVIAGTASVPNLVGDTLAGVGIALHNAGLVIGSISDVVDYTCNYVGRVKAQYPARGTAVAYGSAVSIYVGERPPYPHQCP
jgi:alpha-tubulin suppressor-like RCC1 family protein